MTTPDNPDNGTSQANRAPGSEVSYQQYPSASPVHPSQPKSGQTPTNQALNTRRAASFGMSLLATLVWAAVNLIVTLAVAGGPLSARVFGAFVGGLAVMTVLGGLATWALARVRKTGWRFWQLTLLALPAFLVLRLIFTAASMGGGAG